MSDQVAQLDEAALAAYLPTQIEGFGSLTEARKFAGGQSNPTFLLTTDKARPDAMAYYESKGFAASHDGLRLTLD